MRLELALIPIIFGLAAAVLIFVKPVQATKSDLSAVFVYWPEAYRYVEQGNASAIQNVVGLVACSSSGVIDAPPGVAYDVLGIACRFKP